ncbi:RNA polymerase sigma factor cnrH [hydrothermal vent metagenome]|uniref:RNA polymerase sigma factor cnrH n=1 Tax=hydrothermal vent metagenome TaxID=652676 RepID=A0A3B0RLU3_9ZZZZ
MTQPTKSGPNGDDDRSLIVRTLEKDDHAFTLLMRRFKLPLYRFAIAHVNDADDAEDIVQETFVAAYRNLARYNPKYEVSTWLYRIALNKCRDLGRKRKTRHFLQRMTPMLEEQVSRFSALGDPETHLLEQNELQILAKKIVALPTKLREPLILCAIENLSQKQAGRILGISPKAVETRVYRARKLLDHTKE